MFLHICVFHEGYSDEELQRESFKLNGGGDDVKKIETIALQSHSKSGTRKTFQVCGSNRNYYQLSSIYLREETNATRFSTVDATYTISEDGLYTLIIGTFSGSCDPYYVVEVNDKIQGSGFIFEQSERTNASDRWLNEGTTLKIWTLHTNSRTNSNVRITIIKQL